MFGLIWSLSARIHYFLRRTMPTNILIAAIMTRRGLKWGVPAMLLAAVYFGAAVVIASLIDAGSPGWMSLLIMICVWNAMKFVVLGPVSVIRLAHVRLLEARDRRAARLPVPSEDVELIRVDHSANA